MALTTSNLRLFIIEAPSPMDLLQSRAEAPALERACSLIGHEVSSFIAKSKREFADICRFISTTDPDQDKHSRKKAPICVHIAAHGNPYGLGIGAVEVCWREIVGLLEPLCAMPHYDGKIILVVSACGAVQQKLTSGFRKRAANDTDFQPPTYLFTAGEDEPTFEGALVSWIVFYYHLPTISLSDKDKVKAILKQVRSAGAVALRYHRWDEGKRKYRHYDPGS